MKTTKRDLLQTSTAFVVDDILIKWRHDSLEEDSLYRALNHKLESREPLSYDEIEFIKLEDNVVIQNGSRISIINYDSRFL